MAERGGGRGRVGEGRGEGMEEREGPPYKIDTRLLTLEVGQPTNRSDAQLNLKIRRSNMSVRTVF